MKCPDRAAIRFGSEHRGTGIQVQKPDGLARLRPDDLSICLFQAEHPTITRPSVSASTRPTLASHGARSSSSNGTPADILAMFASGWRLSPSMKVSGLQTGCERHPDGCLAASRHPHQHKAPHLKAMP